MNTGRASLPALETAVPSLDDDPRWQLVRRIVGSRRFEHATLLSRFLLHVCAETLQGRQDEISEYQIGVQVFDRPRNYRTVEDNIVRNYARQLRKRLSEHFAEEGAQEPLRVEIPLGGYVPVFLPQGRIPVAPDPEGRQEAREAVRIKNVESAAEPGPALVEIPVRRSAWRGRWLQAAMVAGYSVALVLLTLAVVRHGPEALRAQNPAHALWAEMFTPERDTLIIPSDCGFNILEDLTRKPEDLPGYLRNDYQAAPLPGIDAHSQTDLRTQEFTSFEDMQIVTALTRLPEANSDRLAVRFPRDVRMEDLKSGNAVLIGSMGSNPWAAIAQQNLNFRIQYGTGMQEAWVVNAEPRQGEAARYVSQWNQPAHTTYAVVAFEPNLGGAGHLLLIEGLDVAGTQAAAEALLNGNTLQTVLRAARQSDGGLRPFEALLQSTSIESNAANARVVAWRLD